MYHRYCLFPLFSSGWTRKLLSLAEIGALRTLLWTVPPWPCRFGVVGGAGEEEVRLELMVEAVAGRLVGWGAGVMTTSWGF